MSSSQLLSILATVRAKTLDVSTTSAATTQFLALPKSPDPGKIITSLPLAARKKFFSFFWAMLERNPLKTDLWIASYLSSGIPSSNFPPPTSDFPCPLPHSAFRLPTSAFRILFFDFRLPPSLRAGGPSGSEANFPILCSSKMAIIWLWISFHSRMRLNDR